MTRLLLIVCALAFFGLGFDASGPPDVGASEAFAQEHGAETAADAEDAHAEGEEEHDATMMRRTGRVSCIWTAATLA